MQSLQGADTGGSVLTYCNRGDETRHSTAGISDGLGHTAMDTAACLYWTDVDFLFFLEGGDFRIYLVLRENIRTSV